MATPSDLNRLKVTELRDILRDRGQPVGGLKSQLIDRIMATRPTPSNVTPASSSRLPKPPPKLSKASKKPPVTQPPVSPPRPSNSASRLTGSGSRSPASPLRPPASPLRRSSSESRPPTSPPRTSNSPTQLSGSTQPPSSLPRVPSPMRTLSPPRLLSPTQIEMTLMAPAAVLALIYESLPILATHQDQTERPLSSQNFIWDITGPLVEARMVNPEFNRLEQEFRIVARGTPESEQLQVQMDQTPVGLSFDSAYRQRLVQPILINRSAAYVYGLPNLIPGVADAETYTGDFYIKFGTTERSLTYWQLLQGIERYLQWYLRFFTIGPRKYWTDLRYMGIHNGVPVLRLELSQ